jgi:hypothetical protein
MKKKTRAGAFLVAVGFALASLPAIGLAGDVKTKEEPEKCGGYHNGGYHLKCKNEKTAEEGYVERKHKWKNPFSGFTKGADAGKPPKSEKQSEMPHSR